MTARPLIRTVAETGSTNADLLARLRAGDMLVEGEWLVADRQSAGRGRQGRSWFDGAGNFMGSTVVRISAAGPPVSGLSFVAGLALYETVCPLLASPGSLALKWPNDLLLDGCKLAGILLEREGDAVVAGFGVNLARAPDLVDRPAISLAEVGPAPERDLFAAALAEALAVELERWRTFGAAPILARWQSVAHLAGTPLTVAIAGEGTIAGRYAGLEEDGALRLRLADGTMRAIHAGDVTLELGDD